MGTRGTDSKPGWALASIVSESFLVEVQPKISTEVEARRFTYDRYCIKGDTAFATPAEIVPCILTRWR